MLHRLSSRGQHGPSSSQALASEGYPGFMGPQYSPTGDYLRQYQGRGGDGYGVEVIKVVVPQVDVPQVDVLQ